MKEDINNLDIVKEKQKELEDILNKYFSRQKEEVIQYISSLPLKKAEGSDFEEVELDKDKDFIKTIIDSIRNCLIAIAMVSYKHALKYLGKSDILNRDIADVKPYFHTEDGKELLKPLINLPEASMKVIMDAEEVAIDYSIRRSAELIGKKILKDGSIIDNPKANYAITDTTRTEIRNLIGKAVDNGWTNQELADNLEENYSFSEARSSMIARTETNLADNNISVDTYKTAGIKKKRWLTAHDDKVDPHCTANEAQGAIGIDAKFSSGQVAPPSHPNCRCTIIAVIDND